MGFGSDGETSGGLTRWRLDAVEFERDGESGGHLMRGSEDVEVVWGGQVR